MSVLLDIIVWFIMWIVAGVIVAIFLFIIFTDEDNISCYIKRTINGDLNKNRTCPGWVGDHKRTWYPSYDCICCPFLEDNLGGK